MVKFDVVVGNPPYQENDGGKRADGSSNASASPIYPLFVQAAIDVSQIQSLIMPARWLTGAGKGLTKFADNMISSNKFKQFSYFLNSKDVFPTNEITGGVCYFVRDNDYDGETNIETQFMNTHESTVRRLDEHKIGVFIAFKELSSVLDKIISKESTLENNNLSTIVSSRKPFGFGTDFLRNSDKYGVPRLSSDASDEFDIEVFGLEKGKRISKYMSNNHTLNNGHNLVKTHKVFITKAYGGDGAIGEANAVTVLGKPLIGGHNQISTETYLVIGGFSTSIEADSMNKYIKTKFLRALVGIIKTTQDAPRRVYRLVPLQDFTKDSDIDWTKPIAEIDQQLYAKYGLSEDEITFIETHVKEME